jgi:chromosome segregation ATPase
MDYIQILELIGSAIIGGWVSRLLTVRARVRQENAGAAKSEEEVKTDQIDNIRKIVDEIYKPSINDLKNTVGELKDEIGSVKEENVKLKKEIAEVREENARLKAENEEMRDALREIRPDVVPTRRESNARRQPRGSNGQFVKKEE